MKKLLMLVLCVPCLLGAAQLDKPKMKHTESVYKDLTGDGIEEKLVFSYSGPELVHLDVSFRIYQVDPQTKAEKEIFSQIWDTWDIYTDPHGEDYSEEKVRYYTTNFFDRFCYDSSKNKQCQTKCLGSLWCTEEFIKDQIKFPLQVKKVNKEMGKNFEKWKESSTVNEYLQKISLVKVDEKEIERLFREIFKENDIACFSYSPYPEYREMWVWCPSLKRFIRIGSCH